MMKTYFRQGCFDIFNVFIFSVFDNFLHEFSRIKFMSYHEKALCGLFTWLSIDSRIRAMGKDKDLPRMGHGPLSKILINSWMTQTGMLDLWSNRNQFHLLHLMHVTSNGHILMEDFFADRFLQSWTCHFELLIYYLFRLYRGFIDQLTHELWVIIYGSYITLTIKCIPWRISYHLWTD